MKFTIAKDKLTHMLEVATFGDKLDTLFLQPTEQGILVDQAGLMGGLHVFAAFLPSYFTEYIPGGEIAAIRPKGILKPVCPTIKFGE